MVGLAARQPRGDAPGLDPVALDGWNRTAPENAPARDDLVRAIYWIVRGELVHAGSDPIAASRMALRCARAACLRLAGLDPWEAADTLRVSRRTLDGDWERVRAVVDRGVAGDVVPVPTPTDTIVVPPRARVS